MSDYEIKYVGPGPEALDVNFSAVRIGETVRVAEEEAARLLDNGAWELVGGPKKKPKGAAGGEVVSLAVPAGDVHEQPVADAEPPPGGVEEG